MEARSSAVIKPWSITVRVYGRPPTRIRRRVPRMGNQPDGQHPIWDAQGTPVLSSVGDAGTRPLRRRRTSVVKRAVPSQSPGSSEPGLTALMATALMRRR